ncbi:unnamed protein product [Prorocentrum cordatum]|uniref:Uncharacterized protein n=1 Tax=Prorocentrum cordatum TaxID=2364126 RepID=A0ABN9QPL6_9DINO|nr:unnamed protein product [Polarella glacialis]
MPPPHYRSEQALPWYCKSCCGPSGRSWWNHAEARQCAKCKLGKGLVFHGVRKPSAPSQRRKGYLGGGGNGYWDDSVRVAQLKSELAAARKRLAAVQRPPPGGEDVQMEPAADGDAPESVAKDRLREVGDLIGKLKGIAEPSVVATRDKLLAEQAELRAKVAESRPLGQRLREMGAQFTRQQKLRDDQQTKLEGLQAQIRDLQEKERITRDKLAAIDASMEELDQERKKLQGQVPTPGDKASLDEPIKGVGATIEGLGILLQSLGADHQLSGSLTASFQELQRLQVEEAAKLAAQKAQAAAEAEASANVEQAEQQDTAAAPRTPQPAVFSDDPEFMEEVVAAGGEKHRLEEIFMRWGAKAEGEALAKLQNKVRAAGYHGIWEPALPGQGAGSRGGVAVLAPLRVVITKPPGLDSHVLHDGRMMAAHVHAGVKGGFVMLSCYFVVDVKLSPENLAMLYKLYQYVRSLEAMGVPWIVGGDFNMEVGELGPLSWLQSANGVVMAPREPTCLQSLPGRTIDMFMVSCRLLPRVRQPVVVDAETWPHLPVTMELSATAFDAKVRRLVEPRGIRSPPASGCARFPPDWDPIMVVIQSATDSEGITRAWDVVLSGIEFELQGRYDLVNEAAEYSTVPGPPTFELVSFHPVVKGAWSRRSAATQAWAQAARWARHLRRVRVALQSFVLQLGPQHDFELGSVGVVHDDGVPGLVDGAPPAAEVVGVAGLSSDGGWPRSRAQRHQPLRRAGEDPSWDAVHSKAARHLLECENFFQRIWRRKGVWPHLDAEAVGFFSRGMLVLAQADFEQQVDRILNISSDAEAKHEKAASQSWRQWAQAAFVAGARGAHRFLKPKALQEIVDGGVGQVNIAPRAMEHLSRGALTAMARLFEQCEYLLLWPVQPKDLVDVVALCWVGNDPRGVREMATATRAFCRAVRPLGLVLQMDKSGHLTTSRRTSYHFQKYARLLKISGKRHMRYLGHDLAGSSATRAVQKDRLKSMHGKKASVRALQKGAGRQRAARLWATGALPSVGHGATVSGISDRELQQMRSMAGVFCGYRGSGSLTLYLAAQKWNFDPIFHATCSIVGQYAAWVWDGRVTLSRLQRAWMCLRDSWDVRDTHVTWASAQGPLSAMWLSLRRVNWNMASSTILVDDEGLHISLLQYCPSEVLFFQHRSLDRWQSHRILDQLPEAPPADGAGRRQHVWLRALRLGHASLAPGHRGALAKLQSNGFWSPQRRKQAGYSDDGSCEFCGEAYCDLEHEIFGCKVLHQQQEDEETEPYPEDVARRRKDILEAAPWQDGGQVQDFSALDVLYALPMRPAFRPLPARAQAEREWGAIGLPWPSKLYGDGSCLESDFPEERRCGWAVVALTRDLWPYKALFGSLGGPIQSVPRAERVAGLKALQRAQRPATYVTDHLQLQEPLEHLFGNMWADVFARVAAADFLGSTSVVKEVGPGHQVQALDRVLICVKCGAHAVRPNRLSFGLSRACKRAGTGSAGAGSGGDGAIAWMLEQARRGLHPKTGVPLEPLVFSELEEPAMPPQEPEPEAQG